MSKDCKNCEYFHGWDYSDGTPCCNYENKAGDAGYGCCPYNDSATIKNNGIGVEIDTEFMSEYIKHTIINTVNDKAYQVAIDKVQSIINDEVQNAIRERVKTELDDRITDTINNSLNDFMNGSINIGGWYGNEKLITRKQYIAQQIEEKLSKLDKDSIKSIAQKEATNEIDKFTRNLRNEINSEIKMCFDSATRQALTDNVVSMLMSNDTYKRLSESMSSLLPPPKN